MKPISIEILHSILLEMAEEFHKICVANNIPYYMLGGTQLGAIRHNGFIPWDDDMDFGVPREYFNRCIECLKQQLPPRYKLLSMKSSKYIVGLLVKIVDTNTIADYHFVDSEEEYGVNIDIFPLDRTNGNKSKFSRNWWIKTLIDLDSYRLFNISERSGNKKILAGFVKTILLPLRRTSICEFVEKRLITNQGDFIANHSGKWKIKEIVPYDYFGTPTLYRFENTEFFGVENFNKYLETLYGDWHKLPPLDKQHIHLNNVFLKEN